MKNQTSTNSQNPSKVTRRHHLTIYNKHIRPLTSPFSSDNPPNHRMFATKANSGNNSLALSQSTQLLTKSRIHHRRCLHLRQAQNKSHLLQKNDHHPLSFYHAKCQPSKYNRFKKSSVQFQDETALIWKWCYPIACCIREIKSWHVQRITFSSTFVVASSLMYNMKHVFYFCHQLHCFNMKERFLYICLKVAIFAECIVVQRYLLYIL